MSLCFFLSLACHGQQALKGVFRNAELGIELHLSLAQDTIAVPGLELEQCYGYLRGEVNGMWVILKVKEQDGEKALVRAACDRGNDAQDLLLRVTDDGIVLRQVDDNYIRGVKGKKYVKLPKEIFLARHE